MNKKPSVPTISLLLPGLALLVWRDAPVAETKEERGRDPLHPAAEALLLTLGGTIVLNGGDVGDAQFSYPAVTIEKRCVLTALPDKPVTIGQ